MSDQQEKFEHGEPAEGMCCMCTYEDITLENENYVEYQSYPSMKWKPALFEESIVQILVDTQFEKYIEKVKGTDCQAELRRLLADGPPIYVSDKVAFPLAEESDEYVVKLWYSSDKVERSAKLKGALEGEERIKLWNELKEFLVTDGSEDETDDNGKKE